MKQSYIFGGQTGLTYDQIQKQRDIANELLRANMSTPQNVGEGLSAIGRALAAKAIDKRTSRADEANKAAYQQRRGEVFGMLGGQGGAQPSYSGSAPNMAGPTPITFTPETPNPAGLDPSIISAVDRVAPNQPQQMDASAVGTRLLGDLMRDFNLTQDQAAGVVGNLAHETGGFKHMQEIAPVVPGSRGGFGFAQWTGPRRKAFEAWSAENGLDPTSYEANYGFLQHELKNTPEGAVLGPLSQAQTADQAAQVFSNQFLRPGVPAMGSRQQFAQKFADPQVLMALAEVQGDPYASESDKAIASLLMQQTVQAMDPMRQMEMEKARLELDQMRNPQPGFTMLTDEEEAQMGLNPAGVYQRGADGSIKVVQDAPKADGPTSTMQEYEFARSQGYEGTFQQYQADLKKAGASNTTVNNTMGGEVGTIPQGYELFTDPQTGARSMRPIAGGPEDPTKANEKAAGGRDIATQTVTSAAARAREAADSRMVGGILSGVAAMNPSSDNAEIYRQVEVLKSQAIVGNLQAMRDASPTGGALGAVTAPELKMLADKSGALDPRSPNFVRDLNDYELSLLQVIHGPEEGQRIFEATRSDAPTGPDEDGWQTINGVKIRVKQ